MVSRFRHYRGSGEPERRYLRATPIADKGGLRRLSQKKNAAEDMVDLMGAFRGASQLMGRRLSAVERT